MDQRIKERLKDMFAVPRGEAQAWVFVILVILGLAGWITYEQSFARPDPHAFAREREALDAWLADRAAADSAASPAAGSFDFDPNDLPVELWMKLGLSEKQALAIHRYEERGGEFRSKADLARMRVVDPALFDLWRPHILLPDSAPASEVRPPKPWHDQRVRRSDSVRAYTGEAPRRHERALLEVNTCDSAQLVALPGIGPSFARGIIKYRDQLGGFVSLDQLSEVYVLQDKPDAVARIKELLVIDTLMVRRIPINTCTVEELAAHPYLRWKLAKPLIAYRDQHGPFRNVAAVKGCVVITEEVYRKVAPYLTVE